MTWRIFQRWFNLPPRKDADYITDNRGEKFWVYWDVERFTRAAELHVIYRNHWVGIINSLREEDGSLTLADIIVFEKYKLRGWGLGKAMMKEFVRWARANNFKEIRGFIKPHDGSTEEYLTEWYKQQDFIVKDGQILFELQRQSND